MPFKTKDIRGIALERLNERRKQREIRFKNLGRAMRGEELIDPKNNGELPLNQSTPRSLCELVDVEMLNSVMLKDENDINDNEEIETKENESESEIKENESEIESEIK